MNLALLAACSLLGTIAGIAFLIRHRYHDEYSGYLICSLRELWWYLLVYAVVTGTFAFLVTLASLTAFDLIRNGSNGYSWVRALPFFLVGFVAGLYPLFLEDVVVENTTIERLRKAWFRTIVKLQRELLRQVVNKLQTFQRRDNYDRQFALGMFGTLGLDSQGIDRRVRLLFELCKKEIASEMKDPEMMRVDDNVSVGQLFYPLVRHLGRREFFGRMRTFRQPEDWSWIGNRRRRAQGTAADRRIETGDLARESDDSRLLNAIAAGRAWR